MVELISKAEGQPCEIEFDRGAERKSVTITPRYDPVNKKARIGVVFREGVYELKHPTPWAQLREHTEKTFGVISALVNTRRTGVKASDLSGPVGIFSILAVQVHADYRLALSFLVLLNVNLAILNLLPIPVLDGGHIVMAIIERIRRRPLSVKFVEYTTTAFAVLLISFMLYVTFFDLKRFPLFKEMFRIKPQIEQTQESPNNSTETPNR